MFKRRGLIPRIWLLLALSLLACVMVHYNTIVHPFTLADNRHYTFYVFRRLTNPHWIKYAVTPIYVVCGWACIQALGARPRDIVTEAKKKQSGQKTDSKEGSQQRSRPPSLPDGANGARTSFVIIWLATTTLQLITAPLVEPRYLILPWIFWRMHVPIQQQQGNQEPKTLRGRLSAIDHRLVLETAWLLLVNAASGYVFLYCGFEWPQEPGLVQRFMW